MSGVRLLVGTCKGAFILTSDGKRDRCDVSGPHFAGRKIYHVKSNAARNTIRDHVTLERRALVRLFACEDDRSHQAPDAGLPDAVATGAEPFFIIGAIVGG